MEIKIKPIQPSSLILNKNKQVNKQKSAKEKYKNFKEILKKAKEDLNHGKG